MATCDILLNRDFENGSGRKFRLFIEESDMDELWVDLDCYTKKSDETPETKIFHCTIYDGAFNAEEILEDFNECIQNIEDGYCEVSDLIEAIRRHYISGENRVSLNDGWRGPGDTEGTDFDADCRWTEEDDFKDYDEILSASERDVVNEADKHISNKIFAFIEAAYLGKTVKESLKAALQSLCADSNIEIPAKSMKMGIQGAKVVRKFAKQSGRPFEWLAFADMMIGDQRFRDAVTNYLKTALETYGVHICHPFVKDNEVCWNSEKRCDYCRKK